MNVLVFGATSAIALAICEVYAKRKDKIFIVSRNVERLEEVKEHLIILGAAQVRLSSLVLEDLSAHARVIEQAKTEFGRLDVVLVAPGVLPDGVQSIEDNLRDFSINASYSIALAEAIANVLEEQRHGHLGVVSSVAGDRGRQSNYWYGAAKGSVSIFLQGLRNRLHKSGVTVTTIKPGFISTPMTAEFDKGPLWAEPDSIAPKIVKSIEAGSNTTYVPGFWRLIMLLIKSIPEIIFKRLSL
jgi:short-subunit dehydrogenase